MKLENLMNEIIMHMICGVYNLKKFVPLPVYTAPTPTPTPTPTHTHTHTHTHPHTHTNTHTHLSVKITVKATSITADQCLALVKIKA